MSVKIDLHCHSYFSGDGVSSPEQLIHAAKKRGLNGFAITDHNTCDAVTYMIDEGLMRSDDEPRDVAGDGRGKLLGRAGAFDGGIE